MSQPRSAKAEQLFEDIRQACPSFVPVDDEGASDWQDEPNPLDYIRISGLARHLTKLVGDGLMDLVVPVLDLAENALTEGDEYVRELVVVGLLEDLQNDLLHTEGRVRLVDVRAQLRPKAQVAWDELMLFWHGPSAEARKSLPPGSLPDDS